MKKYDWGGEYHWGGDDWIETSVAGSSHIRGRILNTEDLGCNKLGYPPCVVFCYTSPNGLK